MEILYAACYLLLDAARSSVTLRRRTGRAARLVPPPTPVPTAGPRRFVVTPVTDWALAADRAATAELLATRPGTVRRVVAH